MTKTVLIVEDNELNMKLFNDLLEAFGFRTLKNSDGVGVLDIARAERPAVIIMDVNLHGGASGLEVTRRLKADAELRAIPVVAVTAFAMRGDEKKALEAGCEAYLSKPISIQSFIDTVKKFAA